MPHLVFSVPDLPRLQLPMLQFNVNQADSLLPHGKREEGLGPGATKLWQIKKVHPAVLVCMP
eukprot:3592723-Rhodomonas_salina.3